MKWVKASERLPEVGIGVMNYVWIRSISTKCGGMMALEYLKSNASENIEWLDESTPPVSAMEDGWVKELDDMARQKDYWYNRCYQAELCIEKSPCDPDITKEQIEVHKLWEESKRPLPPPPSK